jgi:hypothetical protein
MRVAARTVAVELFLPLHHIAFAAAFLDELVPLIAALARAPAAFDAQHIELALDIAEYEVGSMARAYSITSSAGAYQRPSKKTRYLAILWGFRFQLPTRRRSSAMPSAKYSCSGSALMF